MTTGLLTGLPTALLTAMQTAFLGGLVEVQVVPAKPGVLNSKVEELTAPAYTGPLGG